MKRIIDGVTYNTDTSTRLAVSEYDSYYNHVEYQCVGTLYQTRGGAFFVHEQIEVGRDDDGNQNLRHRFETLNSEEAQKWILVGDVEIFHNPFDDPPEAEAESESSATLFVRIPVSLKRQIEQAASSERLSGNAWAIRCLENCLRMRSA